MNNIAELRVTEAQYCDLKEEYKLSGIIFIIIDEQDDGCQDYSSMTDLENAIEELLCGNNK